MPIRDENPTAVELHALWMIGPFIYPYMQVIYYGLLVCGTLHSIYKTARSLTIEMRLFVLMSREHQVSRGHTRSDNMMTFDFLATLRNEVEM